MVAVDDENLKRAQKLLLTEMTPRDNGVLLMGGPVKPADDLALYRAAVRQAAKNALVACCA